MLSSRINGHIHHPVMQKNQEMSYEEKQFCTPTKSAQPEWMRNVYLTPPLPATPPPSPACWQPPKYIAQFQSSPVASPNSNCWHTHYSLQRHNTPVSPPIQAYQHSPQCNYQQNIGQTLPTSSSHQHAHYHQQQSTPASAPIPSYHQTLPYTQMPPLSSSYWGVPKYYYHYEETPALPTSPGYRYGYAAPYPLQCQSTPVIPVDLPVEPAPEVNPLITPVSSVQDLDKIIRDFETGYSSPRKKDNDSPGGTGKFVKKMVAAIEQKFTPHSSKSFPETKTRHNNSKSDSKNSSNQKSFNGTFTHDSSVKSAEKSSPNLHHQESMQSDYGYNNSPKRAGTLPPVSKHQESRRTDFTYNDSPKRAGTLPPVHKHQESMQTNYRYNNSSKRAGTLSPVRKHQESMQTSFGYNNSSKKTGTLSPVRKHQESMQTSFGYNNSPNRVGTLSPVRKHQESMQTDFGYNDTVKSAEKLSPIRKHQESMQVDVGHNDTLIIDDNSNFDMEEEPELRYKTQPVQKVVTAEVHIEPEVVLRRKREVAPKPPARSESFNKIKVAPKIVAAKLKKPIEVDTDTEIEWIPVKNQKLPRKNSFKKLLSLLTGKKKQPKGNKFFCNLNKSNEEKKSSRDSGYVEKSASSSSISSHGSTKNKSSQQAQENSKFPRRNSGLSSFQQPIEDHFDKWIGHPLDDNTSEKSVIVTHDMINKKDRMILNEIDRSEVRTSLGPFFPATSKNIFTDIKTKLRENSAKTSSSKISKEFINSSLMSSFSNKSPVGSPPQKRSSLIADNGSESGTSYKSLDLLNPALQLPSWKFPSDEIVYDHPKNNWSQSEPFIFEASQNYNQQFKGPAYDESEYDVPRNHMLARPKSSIYEDALSVKRRTESFETRPGTPNFFVPQNNEEMHFATIKPRPRVLSSQQILKSMADDEGNQLRSPYLVKNLCL
ncbi:uncharacterized protein LOC130667672 [Microplitis mediator]|uniref:uncharacterized protein LOC130667672 n=1 Tax=Microplitis mediator TaxID=375433 RepID=UPI0025547066|nr:uncharacterized protein LOC130667672 [Microplitis mediator]